ncbi:MAG TPA: DUF488 domain-containing protein [Methylomirabilota bacterium]|nr:DUF488 domain-containing protein [Methylomirabilota bacterium]
MIRVKRVYEKPSPADGLRVLVDRLWPRGLSKQRAAVDVWLKDVAPSPELRKWFGHDPARWKEFQSRYRKELRAQKEALGRLRRESRTRTVTLLYGARDEEHNGALVLKEVLEDPAICWASRGSHAHARGARYTPGVPRAPAWDTQDDMA